MKYEYMDKFLSTKMEENTCLERHLAIMHGYHERLVVDLDYWMIESFAIEGVLRSLPPSYKDFVMDYVMRGESFTFHELLAVLWTEKMEPIAGKVIDDEGIYDIHVIDVLPYKHSL